jgi:guanylate kinase
MSFSPEVFDQQIHTLTRPEYGLVLPTEEPDVYRLPSAPRPDHSAPSKLAVITGPSRAGKDSVISALLDSARYKHVKTATTRAPRQSESPDAYTWMRQKREGESDEEYLEALIEEYGLVEHDVHHGDVYGLPEANISAPGSEELPLLNTDTRGIRTLQKRLDGEFAVTSVLVCPDSAIELQRRVGELNQSALGRLATAQAYLEEAPTCVNYVLHNKTSDTPEKAIRAVAAQVDRILRREFDAPELSD